MNRDLVTRMVSAHRVERYARAVEMQGPGFTELRTPPRDLPLDDRGLAVVPAAEMFGPDRHSWTAGVLSGEQVTTWGWPDR